VRGSIRPRGDAWQLRVFAATDADGRKRYASRTVRGSREDAERALASLVAQVHDSPTTPSFGTVGELCEKWLAYAAPNLAPGVAEEYRRLVERRIAPTIGAWKLHRLTSADLDAWYAQLSTDGAVDGKGLSANSVRRVHSVLHRALEQGIAWEWITINPARRATPPPAPRSRLRLPSAEEVNSLIDAARVVNDKLPVFIRLAAVTGARRGELCGLRWRHVDVTRSVLHIAGSISETSIGTIERPTKTHAERRLTLDPTTLALLTAMRSPEAGADAFVFTHDTDGGSPWRPNYVTLAFGRLVKQVGLTGVRLHDLRHFAATTMLVNGIDMRTAAGRLGHARTSTTVDIYAHYTEPADQRAAATLADALAPPDIA
jgi:integrase